MLTYRWMWRTVAGGFLLLALGVGLLVLPAEIWIILAALAVPFGLMLVIGARRRLHVVKLTVAGYLVAVGSVVLIRFLGMGALVLLGVVLATSPSAVRLFGARLVRSRRTDPLSEATVSTRELCRQWLDSYEALNQASTARARLRVVMARQRCLDELERRDPDGLQAWLASSSASAGSDPHRFLT